MVITVALGIFFAWKIKLKFWRIGIIIFHNNSREWKYILLFVILVNAWHNKIGHPYQSEFPNGIYNSGVVCSCMVEYHNNRLRRCSLDTYTGTILKWNSYVIFFTCAVLLILSFYLRGRIYGGINIYSCKVILLQRW